MLGDRMHSIRASAAPFWLAGSEVVPLQGGLATG